MELSALNGRGLVLIGCGRMGGALLQGWLKQGLAADAVHVIDPNPKADLSDLGISINGELPAEPAVLVIAVKPGEAETTLARALMSAVGRVVTLDSEAQMDAVTALSGSGPAYVFHMIEAMAAAGEAEGLSPALALELARATVAGAGALAVHADEDP
ncbi:pyrroline-5-carboxylate reductase dimerization domain-containing protein, partial [Paracoccus sp. (in: a-proteobacteria)]|uniref:pyrroline-5-carboxylate reductase dimerization domain-containing protein n=1 Tax=Paracoccus sp. TaxID=267 RepID=UPI0028B1CDF3